MLKQIIDFVRNAFSKGSQVEVLGTVQAVNTTGFQFSAVDDTSPNAKHFTMIPCYWQGFNARELPDDVVFIIQHVHCSRAPLSINSFEVFSNDGVVAVTLNNSSLKLWTVEPGDIRVDALLLRTGYSWRNPPPPPPDDSPAC